MKRLFLSLAALLALFGVGAAGFVYLGLYDVSATDQHLRPTFRLLELTMQRAVKRRAAEVHPPPLEDPALVTRGVALYRLHCVQCHGAPGVAPEPFALGLKPLAVNLAHAARVWSASEIFWVVENGLKMTGMPAWKFRMSEEDLWAIVAFVRTLPRLSPKAYQAMAAEVPQNVEDRRSGALPEDPERGKTLLQQYACVTCHHIPGLVGPDAPVGPPLDGIASRAIIAGVLPNEPGEMERWLRSPQQINPGSAMPDLRVSERDARDMAAYLAKLK